MNTSGQGTAPAAPSVQELAEAALAASAADGCIILIDEHSEANLRWAANSLTTNGQLRSRRVTAISVFERGGATRAGLVTRTVTTIEEARALARRADAAGRQVPPRLDASPLVGRYDNDDDWTGSPGQTSIEVFGEFAAGLRAVLDQWRRRDRLLSGFAHHQLDSHFLASSTGLRRRFDQPDGRLDVTGKSGDLRSSSWSGLHTRDFADVDLAAVAEALDERLGWQARRVTLPAGRYETILPPAAVADLMIRAYQQASARDADEGRNVYASAAGGNRIGERLSALPLTLRSDPAAAGLQCLPFDVVTDPDGGLQSVFDNGQPVTAVDWISQGRLADLVCTRWWAGQAGRAARPMPGNLMLDAGSDRTLAELIASTERGLLLTCLWYVREVDQRTLLLTGLTRDGVYLVENGRVRGAVNNFRFNESPVDLLGRATEAGASEPALPRDRAGSFHRVRMPPLRVPDFNMSTVSAAI